MLLHKLRNKLAARQARSYSSEQRQRLFTLATRYAPVAGILLALVGVIWLLLLPYDGYSKRTYISENALLPGQVNVYYGYNDIQTAEFYRNQLRTVQTWESQPRASYLESEFRKMGFVSGLQRFKHEDKTCVNAFAVYRAPRSDGKEALVLGAPWISRTGDYNTNGMAVMLSLAKLFKRNVYWSKDVILLTTDCGMAGAQAWVDAYHGLDQKDLSSLVMPRSGAIQGVINLDFPGTHDYASLGLFYEGVNGQLPNLDLINTLVVVAGRTARVPITLHDDHASADGPWGPYLDSLRTMLRTMTYQASGHPSSEAGVYLRYKIDAVTVHGILDSDKLDSLFGFQRIGMLIESCFRSLNNLLEHFHQSFFFYLLPQANRYVSIGVYMPPAILLAASLILHHSLVLYYCIPSAVPTATTGAGEGSTKTKTAEAVPLAYSLEPMRIGFALTVLLATHIAGLGQFLIMQSAPIPQDLKLTACAAVALLVIVVGSVLARRRVPGQHDARMLKALCLALSGCCLSTIALLNFSISVVTALLIVVPYTLATASPRWPIRILQWIVLAALSPPCLVWLVSVLTDVPMSHLVSILLGDHHVVRAWLLIYICLGYWPVNMAMHILLFSRH